MLLRRAGRAAHRDEAVQLEEAQLHERQPFREQPLERLVPRRALQQRYQQPEGLLLVHVHEEDGGDVRHALHVAHQRVVHGVRFQHAEQLLLPQPVALAVVDVLRVRPRHVADDVHLARARPHQQLRQCKGGARRQCFVAVRSRITGRTRLLVQPAVAQPQVAAARQQLPHRGAQLVGDAAGCAPRASAQLPCCGARSACDAPLAHALLHFRVVLVEVGAKRPRVAARAHLAPLGQPAARSAVRARQRL